MVPVDGGGYEVTVRSRDGGEPETRTYRDVIVANGHHWDPRWPEPSIPGADTFPGEQLHAHYYRNAEPLVGKRVLVLGIGNSACDIAVESSRVATSTDLAMRRGAHILPKYMFGMPTDHLTDSPLARGPVKIQQVVLGALLRLSQGKVTDYGLPEAGPPGPARAPDREPGPAQPARPRRHHRPAEPRPVRGVEGVLHRRRLRRVRRGRLLHRLPRQLPVLHRGGAARRGQPRRPLPPGRPPRPPGPLLRRPDPAAGRDHAARGGAGRVGRRPRHGGGRAASGAGDAPADRGVRRDACASATSPPSGTRSRSTSTATGPRSPRSGSGRASGSVVRTGSPRRFGCSCGENFQRERHGLSGPRSVRWAGRRRAACWWRWRRPRRTRR